MSSSSDTKFRTRVNLGFGQMLLVLFRPASPWRLKGFRGRFVLLHEEDKTFAIPLPGGGP